MAKVRRFDTSRLDGAEITSQGYLKAYALATRSGIFNYLNADGSVRKELRHPEDVFEAASMASLAHVVVTDTHPYEPVNAENSAKYARGWTGEKVEKVGDALKVPVVITDKALIEQVMGGEKEQVSCGYFCDMDETPGIWNGQRYDARQKNIVYNHLANVPAGRAGPEFKIRLDALEAVMQETDSQVPAPPAEMPMKRKKNPHGNDEKKNNGEGVENLLVSKTDSETKLSKERTMAAKIKIDAVEFEVTETVAQAVNAKLDALAKSDAAIVAKQKEVDTLQGKFDAAESESKKLRADLEEAKKSATISDKELLERADSLIKIRDIGKAVLGKEAKVDEMDIAGIKKAVVQKELPEKKLDGVSAEYIDGVFDSLVERARKDAGGELKEALSGRADGGGSGNTVDAARAKQRADALTGWKTYGQAKQ